MPLRLLERHPSEVGERCSGTRLLHRSNGLFLLSKGHGISQKVLVQQSREREEHRLVDREVFRQVLSRVDYSAWTWSAANLREYPHVANIIQRLSPSHP